MSPIPPAGFCCSGGGGGEGSPLGIGGRVAQTSGRATTVTANNVAQNLINGPGTLSVTITNTNPDHDVWVDVHAGFGDMRVLLNGYSGYMAWTAELGGGAGTVDIGTSILEASVQDPSTVGDASVLNISSAELHSGFLLAVGASQTVSITPVIQLIDDSTAGTYTIDFLSDQYITYIGVPVA